MIRYTFSQLLNGFFYTNDFEIERKQKALAEELGVSKRTINNWFSGEHPPRSADIIERIADILWLNRIQTDLLLYSVNENWIKYDTPLKVLKSFKFYQYQELKVKQHEFYIKEVPSIEQIEHDWHLIFQDEFDGNHQKWGTGIKDCGYGCVKKYMENKQYILSLQANAQITFMGGDSACQSPETYYLRFTAKMIQGDTDDAGYGIIFEEISDNYFALFRIRENQRRFSVVQFNFPGDELSAIHIDQEPALPIRPKEVNTLALLAIGDKHFFYVNESLVGKCIIPRLPISRLDVGIIGPPEEEVVCAFQDFRIYVPEGIDE